MSVDNVPATSQRRMWYVAAGIAASVLVGVVVLVVIAVRPAAGGTRVDDTDARLSYVMPDGWRTSEGVGGFGQTSAIEVGGGLDGFDEPTGLAVYGKVLFGFSAWDPEEVSRSLSEVGDLPAGTVSVRGSAEVDDLSPVHLSVTVVSHHHGPHSFVVAFSAPEGSYDGDIDRIHDSLGMAS